MQMAKTARQIKISKEELQHDEVLEFTDKAIFWIKTHFNKILAVLAAIFAIYAVTLFFQNKREGRLLEANNAFFEAMTSYETALNNFAYGTPERASAMQQVALKADDVMRTYEGTNIARAALFLKGNAFYFAGDPLRNATNTQQAIAIFEEYAEKARREGDGFEYAAAVLALGHAYENLYILNFDEAALRAAEEQYRRIDQIEEAGFIKWEAKNSLARLLAFNGKTDEARALYMEVLRARYEPLPELAPDANQRDFVMYQLRSMTRQFTAGNNALMGLRRLGEDVESLMKQMAEEKKSSAPAKSSGR